MEFRCCLRLPLRTFTKAEQPERQRRRRGGCGEVCPLPIRVGFEEGLCPFFLEKVTDLCLQMACFGATPLLRDFDSYVMKHMKSGTSWSTDIRARMIARCGTEGTKVGMSRQRRTDDNPNVICWWGGAVKIIGRVSYLIYVSMRHYVLTTSGDIVVCFHTAVCLSC